jgi:hypothetical protein
VNPDRDDLDGVLDETELLRSLLDASLCSIESDVGLDAPGVASQENLSFSVWSAIVCASACDVGDRDMESDGSRTVVGTHGRPCRARLLVGQELEKSGRKRGLQAQCTIRDVVMLIAIAGSRSRGWSRRSQDCADLGSPPAYLRAYCM